MAVREEILKKRTRQIVLFTQGHTEPNGGLARHSRLLAEGFVAAGWQVRVIARAGTLWWPRAVVSPGLRVLELPGFRSRRVGGAVYLAVAIPLGLAWARRARGLLALHLGSTAVAAGLCGRLLRKPYLVLSTFGGPSGDAAEAAQCQHWGLRRRLLRSATYLVAQGPHTAQELSALGDPSRIAVVPNPVELPEPVPLDGRPRVLFLGRLSSEKDPGCLLAAWPIVLQHRPDAKLEFVGAGKDWRSVESELRDRAALDASLQDSVSFKGWTNDVPRVLAEHDIFVLSSLSEGMSNSLLEACAHGRVVVASDIASNRAVLGDDYPLLFPAGDFAALAEKLLIAMESHAIRRLAVTRARRAVLQNDVPRVVQQHADLLAAEPRHIPCATTSS